MDPAIREGVRLVEYDAAWPARFAAERLRLHDRLPHFRAIEHIGSTAVPGMPAKPVIDMVAGVDTMAIADESIESILDLGYTTSPPFNATLADRRWFMRSAAGTRTHHLHVVVWGGRPWTEFLRFRDALHADAGLAARYVELKRVLADRFRSDREAYTNAKADFVASALSQARG